METGSNAPCKKAHGGRNEPVPDLLREAEIEDSGEINGLTRRRQIREAFSLFASRRPGVPALNKAAPARKAAGRVVNLIRRDY